MSAVELPIVDQDSGAPAGPLLRTLALCDLVDSTGLVERLGDQRAAALMRRHDRLARDLLHRYNGQEIDKTDGFLVLFERPIQAIAFALAYQRELTQLSQAEQVPLLSRIGIHVGDLLIWHNSPGDVVQGAKPVEVEGLVKPVTARLASLALPGQILVSGVATSLAQRGHDELGAFAERARWINHGRYRFKGVPEPLVVYEIGEPGIAPLRLPPYSGKAHREVPWWRRPATMAVEAALILGALALTGWFIFRPQPAIAFAQRDWIVLGDFQNLTGQSRFDDSLRAALRIGLEQSRYVNVVSDLQVRDAIRRMQRDPTQTRIDRSVGAEVAMREGARALVLPSVAEVGGKLRVTTEVVDPKTQATVYSDSAEGTGAESVLPSLDSINQKLRGRLGETLASINADDQPLAKATTRNLDALRAYSLGRKAQTSGKWGDALALYRQATQFDPDFALAYLGVAALRLSADDRAGGQEDLKRALALRDKLSDREALYMDALAASFDKPTVVLEKWNLLAQMYPDYYAAFANYALFAMQDMNQYEQAIRMLRQALSPHNDRLSSSYYLLGTLLLATEDYSGALENLKRAKDLGSQGLGLVVVEAHAAMRRFDLAEAALTAVKLTGVATNDVARWRPAIVLNLDRGRWTEALDLVGKARDEAARVGPLSARVFRGVEVGLGVVGGEERAALKTFVDGELAELKRADDPDRQHSLVATLFGAYLAARRDDLDTARRLVAEARGGAEASGYPNAIGMLAIANAEILRKSDKAADAAKLLSARVDGTELYLMRVALRDAYASAGQHEQALGEAQWLSTHRGRAYAEYNSMQMLTPLNVVESTLSLLVGAEQHMALGRKEEAAQQLAAFRKAWPEADKLPFVAPRLTALQNGIHLATRL